MFNIRFKKIRILTHQIQEKLAVQDKNIQFLQAEYQQHKADVVQLKKSVDELLARCQKQPDEALALDQKKVLEEAEKALEKAQQEKERAERCDIAACRRMDFEFEILREYSAKRQHIKDEEQTKNLVLNEPIPMPATSIPVLPAQKHQSLWKKISQVFECIFSKIKTLTSWIAPVETYRWCKVERSKIEQLSCLDKT